MLLQYTPEMLEIEEKIDKYQVVSNNTISWKEGTPQEIKDLRARFDELWEEQKRAWIKENI
ncbi:MAG: hypothetical protein PUB11_03920 [Oscillospiraceae bacterium]|nr:hypothetical protein [Oscillospiraceae bacterium]